MINRPLYLEKLKRLKDKQLIKVVTGIRRCGKSTILELFRSVLQKDGVAASSIIAVNLEEGAFRDIADWKDLYTLVEKRLVRGKKNYVFLDEVHRDISSALNGSV